MKPFRFSCLSLSLLLFFLLLNLTTALTSSSVPSHRILASTTSLRENPVITTDSEGNYHVLPSIKAVAAIVAGIIICFFGWKLYHPMLYALTFLCGGTLTYLLVITIFTSYDWAETAAFIAFFVGGFIILSIVKCYYFLAIFLVGAVAGIYVALFLNTSFLYRISPSHPDTVLWISIIVFGILGGILTRALERPAIIIATCILGSIMAIWGIGYFAGDYPSGMELEEYTTITKNGEEINLPNAWWGYFAGTILMCGAGIFVQFKLKRSKKEHDYEYSHSRRGNLL